MRYVYVPDQKVENYAIWLSWRMCWYNLNPIRSRKVYKRKSQTHSKISRNIAQPFPLSREKKLE